MKLIIVIVRDADAGSVIEQLLTHGYRMTRVVKTGSFLRRGNVTLLISVEEQPVQPLLTCSAIHACRPNTASAALPSRS